MVSRRLIYLVAASLLLISSAASFAGGSGTSSDPYEIATCQQLQDMKNNLSASYELIGNVNCGSYTGFNRVGTYSGTGFSGVLDGNGHVIRNLTIDQPTQGNVGLFGELESSGVAKKFGMVNAQIIGQNWVGGVAGTNKGSISYVFLSGSVSGSGSNRQAIGGIHGYGEGSVRHSYNLANVSGYKSLGGIAGSVSGGGRMEDSYNAGLVYDNNCCGYVGSGATDTIVNDGYWDINASGQTTTDGGWGVNLTTKEMNGSAAKTNMSGLNFSTNWEVVKVSDSDTTADGYPILRSVNRTEQLKEQGIYLPNEPPFLNSQELVWKEIGGNEKTIVNYSTSDPDGDDISSHNTIPEGTEELFSNSTFKISGFTSPFDYYAQITDFAGATASIETNSVLPERVERVLPERHKTITFCMIWQSVLAVTAA